MEGASFHFFDRVVDIPIMLRRQVRLFTGAFLGQGCLLPGIVSDRPPCRFHWCSSWRRRSSSSLSWCKVRSPWSRLFQQTTEIFPLQYIDEVIDALVVVATVFLPMMLMILRGTALCRRREISSTFKTLLVCCDVVWCVCFSPDDAYDSAWDSVMPTKGNTLSITSSFKRSLGVYAC